MNQLRDSLDGLLHDFGVQKTALIVGGEPLLKIFNDVNLKKMFLEIGEKVNVVLACRVSPK